MDYRMCFTQPVNNAIHDFISVLSHLNWSSFCILLQRSKDKFCIWPWKVKMSGLKKEHPSPEVIECDEEEKGSPVVDRGNNAAWETSEGRFQSNSDGERFNNKRDGRCFQPGPHRPPPGKYCPYPRESRLGREWKSKYSPGFYHPHSSSSSGVHIEHHHHQSLTSQ